MANGVKGDSYTEEYKQELIETRTKELSSAAFQGKTREQWIKDRQAEIVIADGLDSRDSGDLFMAESEATAEYGTLLKEVKTRAQTEIATREAYFRSAKQKGEAIKKEKASAVVRANEAAAKAGLIKVENAFGLGVTMYLDQNTGQYYDEQLRHLPMSEIREMESLQAEVRLAEEQAAEAARNKNLAKAKDLKQFTKNLQAQLFNKMGELNGDEFKILCDQKVYRISKNESSKTSGVGSGAFTQRLSTEGLFTGTNNAFLEATPAQLSSLVPLLRFYIVDQDGNQEEIYFSDIVSEQHIKKMAELKGKSVSEIINYKTSRGGEAGIKSFTWNFNNKHEGDFIIEADLELYFGSLVELANVNYLRFLFPTGNDVDVAEELTERAKKSRAAKSTFNRTTSDDLLKKMQTEIDKYKTVLQKGNKEIESFVTKNNTQLTASSKKNFRQLKVIVGWSLPEGNREQLQSIFGKDKFKKFKEDIEKTHTAILLNLADYNVNFTQEGPTTLSLKYFGSTDNYLASDNSDIFGSNNFNPDGLNDFMYKDTEVSLEGILEENNILSDAKGANSGGKSSATTKIRSLGDPYLNKLYSEIKKREGGSPKNIYGQRYLVVQMAGLRLAQELVTLELKLKEAKNVDPKDDSIKKIKRRGQYIVILYQRALRTRLRDMYSTFLRQMIEDKVLRVGYADTEKDKPILNLNPRLVAVRQEIEQVAQAAAKAAEKYLEEVGRQNNFLGGLVSNLLEKSKKEARTKPSANRDSTSQKFYYFFLGDIFQIMAKTSGLREDITLLLGNFEDVNGNIRSIYNIPISIETFAKFFFERIVATQLTAYPFRRFMNDFLNFVAKTMNQNPQTSERISFDYTTIYSSETNVACGKNNTLTRREFAKIRKGMRDPLSKKNIKYQAYYAIFVKKTGFGDRTGSIKDDVKDGIFHYMVGSDRGLAKTFNFSRQETQYFQEMLIESNNPEDRIQALFLPQNVNIEMYGNSLHRNGDLIYVDTRAALGDFAGKILGIGGYYRVIRSTHQITNQGYNTTLDCVFELRTGNKKRKKPSG